MQNDDFFRKEDTRIAYTILISTMIMLLLLIGSIIIDTATNTENYVNAYDYEITIESEVK